MKNTDAAYIAALIDAVGCIKIEPPKKDSECCLYVWVTRNDFKLMEYLQRYGAFIIHLDDGQFRAKWTNRSAYNLLKSIITFSKMKKEQIDCGIEFMEVKSSENKETKFDIPFRLRLKLLKKEE